MSDSDATQARQNVVANVDEIIEHIINANMLSMPYDVYSELFDAVDGLGVEIENLQAENAKLRDELDQWHRLTAGIELPEYPITEFKPKDLERENAKLQEERDMYRDLVGFMVHPDVPDQLAAENAKLRELVSGLHMAYVKTLNECESLDEGLIWEYSGSVKSDVAKSKARFEADRHRFDTALRELGVEL